MTAAPVSPKERIEGLDVLRGAAVLGMILVNMSYYAGPIYVVHNGLAPGLNAFDRIATWFVFFFCTGKITPIFSSLFGLGIALQIEKGEETGERYLLRLIRRMIVLLAIGLAHAFLLWYGDALTLFASLGFLVLFFRKASAKTLLWTAISVYLITVLVQSYLLSMTKPEDIQASAKLYGMYAAKSIEDYAHGSFKLIFDRRVVDLKFIYSRLYMAIPPETPACFLFGLYWGRKKIPRTRQHFEVMRKWFWWTLIVAFGSALLFMLAYVSSIQNPSSEKLLWTMLSYRFSTLALPLFYVEALLLMQYKKILEKLLKSMAFVGRAALSNYLFQSLVCTTLFYSYGFGLFGKISPGTGLLLSIAIYSVQSILSLLWFRKFAFGPLEWLWRSLTYGEWLSLTKAD